MNPDEITMLDLIDPKNRVVDMDLLPYLSGDRIGMIYAGIHIYPLFYHRHTVANYVRIDAPIHTQYPWIIFPKDVFVYHQCEFDCVGPLDGTTLLQIDTDPFFVIKLETPKIDELRGREYFAFLVARSQIVPYSP